MHRTAMPALLQVGRSHNFARVPSAVPGTFVLARNNPRRLPQARKPRRFASPRAQTYASDWHGAGVIARRK